MPFFSTPAILLRRIPHGDYDLIITFMSQEKGKLTVIAKNAKKSQKRFGGILEPFSQLHLICTFTKGRSLGALNEASLENPFSGIRGNMVKTAYASYWSELINIWCEEGRAQEKIYGLLKYCLHLLDSGEMTDEGASIVFQMRFLNLAGLTPNLLCCGSCKKAIDKISGQQLIFELAKGSLVCQGCSTIHSPHSTQHRLSMGTVNQLLWIQDNELKNLNRLKFTRPVLDEGLKLLEAFVPYHLGKEPKSLSFLRSIR